MIKIIDYKLPRRFYDVYKTTSISFQRDRTLWHKSHWFETYVEMS